ncbi:hypothetical protein BKA81DRAFT_365111 [Phyllosticta paracitricarpa]
MDGWMDPRRCHGRGCCRCPPGCLLTFPTSPSAGCVVGAVVAARWPSHPAAMFWHVFVSSFIIPFVEAGRLLDVARKLRRWNATTKRRNGGIDTCRLFFRVLGMLMMMMSLVVLFPFLSVPSLAPPCIALPCPAFLRFDVSKTEARMYVSRLRSAGHAIEASMPPHLAAP